MTEEEIAHSLEEGVDAGVIEEHEHQMVQNVFLLDDRLLTSLMLPRSSSAKNGLMLANTVGLIDPDYRGPVLVALAARWGDVQVRKGDRVAQALFVPFVRPVFQQVAELVATGRGAGGFGSTG